MGRHRDEAASSRVRKGCYSNHVRKPETRSFRLAAFGAKGHKLKTSALVRGGGGGGNVSLWKKTGPGPRLEVRVEQERKSRAKDEETFAKRR